MGQDLQRVLDRGQLGGHGGQVSVVKRVLDFVRQRRPVISLLQSPDSRLKYQKSFKRPNNRFLLSIDYIEV